MNARCVWLLCAAALVCIGIRAHAQPERWQPKESRSIERTAGRRAGAPALLRAPAHEAAGGPVSSRTAPPVRNAHPGALTLSPRAIAYQRANYLLLFASLLWQPLGLWLLLVTGISAGIRSGVYRLLRLPTPAIGARSPPLLAVAGYYAGYSAAMALWMLPVALASFGIERWFGFSSQSVVGLLGDALLGLGLHMLWIPVVWLGWRLLAAAPQRWWLWLWLALIPLLLFQIVLQPVVIDPLYNRFTPLPPGPLRTDILALAGRAGITGGRVLVQDTSRRTRHVNAYVTGLGPTTRIVINDTALRELPHDQILAMVGHEMGHYVEGHIWFEFASSVLGTGIFLRLAAWLLPALIDRFGRRWRIAGILDPAAYPALALLVTVFLFLQDPIMNAESRYIEHRADAFGLRVTGLRDANIRLFAGFAERDYSDPDPPALIKVWFYTHPPIEERIEYARSFNGS